MGIMDVTDHTFKHIILSNWVKPELKPPAKAHWLAPLRRWIDGVEVTNPLLAHRICFLIPSQCPFARKVELFGRTWLEIPPLCKLNPLYDELMGLRFRAISYLADECGEDVSAYC